MTRPQFPVYVAWTAGCGVATVGHPTTDEPGVPPVTAGQGKERQVKETREVDILLLSGHLVTMVGTGVGYLADGALAIEGDRIAEVGPSSELAAKYEARRTIDAGGKVVLPGLVDAHTHSPETLLRGVAQDVSDYMEKAMAPFSRAFTPELALAGTRLHVLEALKAGITTYMDFCPPFAGWAEVYQQIGVRARLTPTINSLAPGTMADRVGTLYVFDETKGRQAIDAALAFADQWQGRGEGRITAMLGPQAPDMVPLDQLVRVKDAAERHGLMIHMHVAQGDRESRQMASRYGTRSVPFLDSIGYLDDRLFAVHLTEATDDEVELLVGRGARMGLCSGSIALIDGIVPPAWLYRELGGTVALGTDSASSNNSISLFHEMKLTALLNKVRLRNPEVMPAWEVLRMATIEGARAIGLGDTVGSLEAGKQADVILIDLDALNLSPVVEAPVRNIVPNLVYAATGHEVDTAIVAGRVLMEGRRLLTADEEAIRREAQSAGETLSRRVLEDPQHTGLTLLKAMRAGKL